MEFNVMASKGEYKDFKYRYTVFMDGNIVWEDDFAREYTDREVLMMMFEDVRDDDSNTYDAIKKVLSSKE